MWKGCLLLLVKDYVLQIEKLVYLYIIYLYLNIDVDLQFANSNRINEKYTIDMIKAIVV